MKQKRPHGLTLRFLSILLSITLFITSFIANPVKAKANSLPNITVNNLLFAITTSNNKALNSLIETFKYGDSIPKLSYIIQGVDATNNGGTISPGDIQNYLKFTHQWYRFGENGFEAYDNTQFKEGSYYLDLSFPLNPNLPGQPEQIWAPGAIKIDGFSGLSQEFDTVTKCMHIKLIDPPNPLVITKPVEISNVTVATDDLSLKLGEKIPMLDKRPNISGFDCCDQIDYTFDLLKKGNDGTYIEYDNDTHTITEGTYKYRLVLQLKNQYIDFSLDPNISVTVNNESWNDIKTESDDAGTKLLGLECYSKEITVTKNGTSTPRVEKVVFSISGFSEPVFNGNVPTIKINVETPGVTVNKSKTGWYYCPFNSRKYILFTGNTFNDEGTYEYVIYFDSKDAVLDKYTTIAEKQDSGTIIINCFMNGENYCAETSAYGLYLDRIVTFKLDGEEFGTEYLKPGDHVSKPDNPRNPTGKETAEFAGWFTDPQFTEKFDFSERVYNDMTLYATWVPAPKACENGSFVDANGATTAATIKANIDPSYVDLDQIKELLRNAQKSIDSLSIRPKVNAKKKSSVPKGTTDKIIEETQKAGSPLENTDTSKQSTDLFDVSLELMLSGQNAGDIKDLNGKYAEIIVPFPEATSVDKAVVTHVKDDGTTETLAKVDAGTPVGIIKTPSYALDSAGLHLYGTTYSIYAITYTTKTNNNSGNGGNGGGGYAPSYGGGSSSSSAGSTKSVSQTETSFNDKYMASTEAVADLIDKVMSDPVSFAEILKPGVTVRLGDASITPKETEDGNFETVIYYNTGNALPSNIMASLKESSNVRLIFSYSYKGIDYKVEITSKEAALFFDPSIPWYGPLWLNGNFSEEARKARKTSK